MKRVMQRATGGARELNAQRWRRGGGREVTGGGRKSEEDVTQHPCRSVTTTVVVLACVCRHSCSGAVYSVRSSESRHGARGRVHGVDGGGGEGAAVQQQQQ